MTHSIDTIIDNFVAIKAQFQKDAQEQLKEVFADFWGKNPGVKAITWTQFAPYFNDGDPCTFSVDDPYFTNAEGSDINDIRWGQYDGDKENIWCEDSFDPRWCKVVAADVGVDADSCKELSRLLQCNVMVDVMEATFGNDATIIATREGFRIEGCEHD